METWKLGDKRTGDMETLTMETLNFKIPNGKGKPRQFSSIRISFAHVANGSLWFFLWTKKQAEVIHLQMD